MINVHSTVCCFCIMQTYVDTVLFRVHVTAVPSLLAIKQKVIMHFSFVLSCIILALPKPSCIFSYNNNLRLELSSRAHCRVGGCRPLVPVLSLCPMRTGVEEQQRESTLKLKS